jgi:mannose-6-phosphate isomerase-like protein (cupin superfamily)
LQTFLIAKGFDIPLISHGGIAKGYFGPSTASALSKYQSSLGVQPTGIFGAVTRSNINSSLCNSNNNPQLPTTAGTPSITVGGTPTFTQNVVNTDQSGNQVTQYVASFNIQVAAVGGNVILGLPGSSSPFVSATSPFISIYKNGVADSLSNYTAIASYAQPTNTTLSTGGTSFVVAQNQTVSIPVTISFQVRNPGANVYGVRLNQVAWNSSSLSNQTATLSGTNFAGNGVPQTPTCSNGQTWNGTSCVTTTTTQSSIQIISPTSGQTVSQGSYLNIQWQHGTDKAAQNVTLYVRLLGQDSLSGGSYTQIVQNIVNGINLSVASSIPSNGQWQWLVPTTVSPGQYEVQVIESLVGTAGLPTDIVVSSPFTIAASTVTTNPTCPAGQTWSGSMCTVQVQSTSGQPYVKIVSPDGGEQYTQGQTVPISFSTNLTSQQAPSGFNIWAYYGGNSTNVGSYSSGVQNIAMSYTGGSPYSWTIPSSVATGNYVMYIVPATLASGISNTGLFAFGDSYFTINAQTTQTPTCSSGQTWNGSSCVSSNQPVTVSVQSPTSGQAFTTGSTVPITWTSTGASNLTATILLERFDDSANSGSPVTVKSITTTNSGSYSLALGSGDINTLFPCPNGCSSNGSASFDVRVILATTGTPNIQSGRFTISGTSVTQPTLSIVAPSGGSYQAGSSLNIQWTATGLTQTNNSLGLAVYETSLGSPHSLLSTQTGNSVSGGQVSSSGSYSWTIPTTAPAGSDYVVYLSNSSSWKQSNPFTITAPVSTNATPQVSISGTPTLTKNTITTSGGTTQINQYMASFNVNVQAVGGPITIGLSNSSWPAFVSTAAGIQINKNGASDSLSNYNPVINYSAPTNVTMSSDGTSFTIGQNQTATIPVNVAFTVTNPGANVYATQLLSMGWSATGQSNQTASLGGSTWQTQSAMSSDNSSLTASIWDAIRQYYAGQ